MNIQGLGRPRPGRDLPQSWSVKRLTTPYSCPILTPSQSAISLTSWWLVYSSIDAIPTPECRMQAFWLVFSSTRRSGHRYVEGGCGRGEKRGRGSIFAFFVAPLYHQIYLPTGVRCYPAPAPRPVDLIFRRSAWSAHHFCVRQSDWSGGGYGFRLHVRYAL